MVTKKNAKNEKEFLIQLLNMDINAKQMSGIAEIHISTAYNYWKKACEHHGKPRGCAVTLGQFLDVYKKKDRDLLISRFWQQQKRKKTNFKL